MNTSLGVLGVVLDTKCVWEVGEKKFKDEKKYRPTCAFRYDEQPYQVIMSWKNCPYCGAKIAINKPD